MALPADWAALVGADCQALPEALVIAAVCQSPPSTRKSAVIARFDARTLGMAVAAKRKSSEASGAEESRSAARRATSVRLALASATARWVPGVAAEASAMAHSAACQVAIGSVMPGTREAAEAV